MDFKQNQKINQVTEKTLVVGIDIVKRTHYACFVDDRGRVLQKSFAVSQSNSGFNYFYQRILTAMKENEKTEVIVGIEPTGHYWLNLAYFLEERGIPLVMTNPMHVKRSKELDDNLPTKLALSNSCSVNLNLTSFKFPIKKIGLGSLSLPLFLIGVILSYLAVKKNAVGEHLLEYLKLDIPVSIITIVILIFSFFLGNRFNTNLFAKSGKIASLILLSLFVIAIITGIIKTVINLF